MSIEKMNLLFTIFTETAEKLKEELSISYLDALLETAENMLEGKIPREQFSEISEQNQNKLANIYTENPLSGFTSEEKAKSFQLAMLKGMKEDYVQPNHQMTPDTIGQLMAFFIQLFIPEDTLRIVDLGSGVGNLLSVVISVEEELNKKIEAEGIEIDELLISLAAVNFALQEKAGTFTHQNALTNLLLAPADVVVSDLPIGYYPEMEIAKGFSASFEEGQSYAHYLLVEQGMKYLKPNGLGMFLIPSDLFEEDASKHLLKAIQEHGYIQAIVELSKEWFQEKSARRSLLIVQNKGDRSQQANEVLFAKAPDFKNQQTVTKFLSDIRAWKENLPQS